MVTSASWSPDGTRIVTASRDRTARIWDGVTGALLVLLEHEAAVNSAAWDPDGARMVTASVDGTAQVWDAATGALLVLLEHGASVTSAAWSPDGTRIDTAFVDGTARVWGADGTGEPLVLRGHEDAVTSAAWSPDGTRIVTASRDGTARVWRADGTSEVVLGAGITAAAVLDQLRRANDPFQIGVIARSLLALPGGVAPNVAREAVRLVFEALDRTSDAAGVEALGQAAQALAPELAEGPDPTLAEPLVMAILQTFDLAKIAVATQVLARLRPNPDQAGVVLGRVLMAIDTTVDASELELLDQSLEALAPALTPGQALLGLERLQARQSGTRAPIGRFLTDSTAALEARWAAEPARLFVHIGDEAQRSGAQTLAARLAGAPELRGHLGVPGIERVPDYHGPAVLRCFRAFECGRDGIPLVALVNEALGSDVARLADLSEEYGDAPDIRPRTYELWLGPDVRLP